MFRSTYYHLTSTFYFQIIYIYIYICIILCLLQVFHDRLSQPVMVSRRGRRVQDGGFGPEQLLRHAPREPDLRNHCRAPGAAAENVQLSDHRSLVLKSWFINHYKYILIFFLHVTCMPNTCMYTCTLGDGDGERDTCMYSCIYADIQALDMHTCIHACILVAHFYT